MKKRRLHRWLGEWVTENDGVTSCPVRTAFTIGILAYFGFTCYDALTSADFVFMKYARDWAMGLGSLLGLGGAGIAGKSFTEGNANGHVE